jgi:hypothetical protein
MLFVVSGCATGIWKHRYFAPNASPGLEVIPEESDPNVHYFINEYPSRMVRIQQPEITLYISEVAFLRKPGLALFGPFIFPVIPLNLVIYPLAAILQDRNHDYTHVRMEVTVSKADSISWDISKCVMILPNGERVVPEEYWVGWFSPEFFPMEIMEAHNINTKWHSISIYIKYPVTTKEAESFRLEWAGLVADSKDVVIPEMEFKKASIWIGEIDKGF